MLCDQVEFATDRDVFISYICYYHLYYLSIGDTEFSCEEVALLWVHSHNEIE